MRSGYIHLVSAPGGAGCSTAVDTAQAAITRLAALLMLVAALPDGGGVVLVSHHAERAEVKDLILQYRGTPTCDGTRVVVGSGEDAEYAAAAGVERHCVFLVPGYQPKGLILAAMGALEFNVQGGWWGRKASDVRRERVTVVVPQGWEEAAPAAAGAESACTMQDAAPRFASVKLGPLPAGRMMPWPKGWEERPFETARPTPKGPWHRPAAAEAMDPTVTVSLHHGGPSAPWRLYAPLPSGCGGGLNRVFLTRDAADAALPAFVAEVRAILTRHVQKAAV